MVECFCMVVEKREISKIREKEERKKGKLR